MTRSVLLVSPYFPPDTGGVENYVWQLARQLHVRHGWRVAVAATAAPGEPATVVEGPEGIPVHRLAVRRRVSNTPMGLGWQKSLRAILAEGRFDVVNAHAPVPLFADTAARSCGHTPFVLTYHTGRMRKGRPVVDAALAGYERTVLTGTARRAHAVIVSSDYVGTDLAAVFGGRCVTISPGVDLDLFRPAPLPEEPRLLFVGSLARATSYKGLSALLKALPTLVADNPRVFLEVVGAGDALNDYRAQAQALGLGGRVSFAGRLEGQALAAAYHRVRALVLPTSYDSFPSVLVEAMAAGRPVVTTPVGGIPSLVSDDVNGLLVPPGNEVALLAALRRVLDPDGGAARLGQAGREFVSRELSWERQSDRTVLVLAGAAHLRMQAPS